MTPIAYLDQNPLLKTDLSEGISFHEWEGYKNELYRIASIVVFVALAVLAIGWASFYAPEALPIITGLIGLGLYVFNEFFAHPCKRAADKHWEALALENRTVALMQVPIADEAEAQFRNSIGATPITQNEPAAALRLGKTFTHAYARYNAVHELSDEILAKIDRLFYTAAEFSEGANPLPQNYRALREAPIRSAAEFDARDRQWTVHEAIWYKLQDQYLEKRINQIFLTYVMSHPFRTGTYNQVGRCLVDREISHRMFAQEFRNEEPFFVFNSNNAQINRTALLGAHQRASQLLESYIRTPDTASQNLSSLISEADRIRLLALLNDDENFPVHELYVKREFTPFIERMVNRCFMNVFLEHDPNKMTRENLEASGILTPV